MDTLELEKRDIKGICTRPIIVCDDHFAISAGLRKLFEDQGMYVAGECDSITGLLDLVQKNPNAVVITDLGVSDIPFPQMVKQLHEKSAECQIVVYSMRESPTIIGLCYEAGAISFIPKKSSQTEVVKTILHAMKGERYFSAEVASVLAKLLLDTKNPKTVLKPREFNIFLAYVKTGTTLGLAEKMDIKERTIQNILSQISKKLNVSRAMFHQIAREHGLIDPYSDS